MLMASDAPPQDAAKPAGFYVSLGFPTPENAEQVFNTLAEGGQVRMAFAPTFFSKGFGMLVDRFDIPWMISSR
jgi:PhnB protein